MRPFLRRSDFSGELMERVEALQITLAVGRVFPRPGQSERPYLPTPGLPNPIERSCHKSTGWPIVANTGAVPPLSLVDNCCYGKFNWNRTMDA